MKLASDWRKVLRYAWSIRLMLMAFLLVILEPVASTLLQVSISLPKMREALSTLAYLSLPSSC